MADGREKGSGVPLNVRICRDQVAKPQSAAAEQEAQRQTNSDQNEQQNDEFRDAYVEHARRLAHTRPPRRTLLPRWVRGRADELT